MNLEENTPQNTPQPPEASSDAAESWEVEPESAPVEPSPWEQPIAPDGAIDASLEASWERQPSAETRDEPQGGATRAAGDRGQEVEFEEIEPPTRGTASTESVSADESEFGLEEPNSIDADWTDWEDESSDEFDEDSEEEPTSEAAADPESQPVFESVSEPEPVAKRLSEAAAEPKPDTTAKPRSAAASEGSFQSVSEPEPVVQRLSEAAAAPKPTTAKPRSAAASEGSFQSVSEPEPVAEPESDPEPLPEPVADSVRPANSETTAEPASEPPTQTEADAAAIAPPPETAIEPPAEPPADPPAPQVVPVPDLDDLERRAARLREEIDLLEASKAELQQAQMRLQQDLGRLVQDGVSELKKRKQALTVEVEQLERRQERIRKEMRTTFAGTSQDIAVRVQGFKNYLVGSLQDLSAAAEQLNVEPPPPKAAPPSQAPPRAGRSRPSEAPSEGGSAVSMGDRTFQDRQRFVRRLLEQYRNNPDYYGPPWQLRRTFEPIHAERVSNWFFTQGGRGAIKSTNSRLQNILIASAIASILHAMHGTKLRVLVLANAPERLGEWRRGLQDCLGISRADFGPNRGVALFEAPEPLAQRADRLVRGGQMPLIVVDESESQLDLSLLQFPLWVAFAPDPESGFVREW